MEFCHEVYDLVDSAVGTELTAGTVLKWLFELFSPKTFRNVVTYRVELTGQLALYFQREWALTS